MKGNHFLKQTRHTKKKRMLHISMYGFQPVNVNKAIIGIKCHISTYLSTAPSTSYGKQLAGFNAIYVNDGTRLS